MNNVFDLAQAGRMTAAAYRLERAALRATYGDSHKESAALGDQALAAFFVRSGWTQEDLAQEEGKSRKWIERHLRFGRFLADGPMGPFPKNLTERRFRGFWDHTDKNKNDRIRFGEVLRLMEEATLTRSHKPKPAIAQAIKSTCGNGEWHKKATIVTKAQEVVKEATEDDVQAVLGGMVQHGWYNVFCEKRKGVDIYRIVIGGNQKIDLVVLQQEWGPILKALKAEGRKNKVTMSPTTVAHLVFQLEQVLVKLAHVASPTPEDAEE